SESMVPTLLVQDRLVVEKISNYTGKPTRGEVLVFYPPSGEKITRPIAGTNDPEKVVTFYRSFNGTEEREDSLVSDTLRWFGFTKEVAYIKRVIGLPGETVEIKMGTVFID